MPNQKKDTPMQITVRLYRQHDMDLVGLYRTKDFKFQRHMKNALKAYAEGKDYRINHPGDEDIRKGYVPKIVQMHIYLTVEQDADAISALKTIREGYRGAFLKALFRKYLNNEPLEAYKDRKDLIFNAEEDYLEAPEEAAGNKKEYDKSRKDFGKSGCDNSAGVSAKKDNWKEKSIPPSGKPAHNQHDSRNGQSGAPEIQQGHHAVQQHQKEIEYRKQKENQKKMQDHQNSDRNRALASDTKTARTEAISKTLTDALTYSADANNADRGGTDLGTYIPSSQTLSGINSIRTPTIMFIMQSGDYTGEVSDDNIALTGIRTIHEVRTIGYRAKDGKLKYSWEWQGAAEKYGANNVTYFESQEEAVQKGYYPDHEFLFNRMDY